jgi:hypothetical protein
VTVSQLIKLKHNDRVNGVLRPTVSRPVCLGMQHTSGAYDQIFIAVRQLRVSWCEALSLQEDGSVIYSCCWSSPALSFSGQSPVGLVTMFYPLRFETFLFVSQYDSQGYSRYIRPASTRGTSSFEIRLPDNHIARPRPKTQPVLLTKHVYRAVD